LKTFQDKPAQLAIDCSSLTYAAFYTMGDLSYRQQKTGVIFGFLMRVLSLAKKFKTNDIVFCWDSNPSKSKRKEIYRHYKERRHDRDEEELRLLKLYHDQVALLRKEILPTIGLNNNFYRSGYEADDLIAAFVLANRMRKHIFMISSDFDLLGCIGEACSYYDVRKKKLFDKRWFERKHCGLDPSWWWEAKSISGCNSDGVKGIVGVADPAKTKATPPPVFKYLVGEMPDGKIKDKIESLKGRMIRRRNLKLVKLPFGGEKGWGEHIKYKEDTVTRRGLIKVFNKYRFLYFLKEDRLREWERMFVK